VPIVLGAEEPEALGLGVAVLNDSGPVVASTRPPLGAVAPTPVCGGLSMARHKAKSRGAATQRNEQRSGFAGE
jgi:hypothetical protein